MKRFFWCLALLAAGPLAAPMPALAACPEGFSGTTSFGVDVCAHPGIDGRDLRHAARTLEGVLDFDGDGAPDNQRIVDRLIAQRAAYVVVSSDRQERRFARNRGNDSFTIVFDDEMERGGDGFDPTVEEALHLVTQFGYAEVYPDDFAERPGSRIADLMDVARGGRFERVPRRYPDDAVYSYDDRSCDYACQVTEFTYWAVTSLRGQQEMPGRAEEIEDEWKLNTKLKIESQFPELAEFLSAPEFGLFPLSVTQPLRRAAVIRSRV